MKFTDVIHAGCLSVSFVAAGCGEGEVELSARHLKQAKLCNIVIDGELGPVSEECEIIGLTEATGDDSDAGTSTTGGSTWDMGDGTTWAVETTWPGGTTGIDPSIATSLTFGGESTGEASDTTPETGGVDTIDPQTGGPETTSPNDTEPGGSTVANTEGGEEGGEEGGGEAGGDESGGGETGVGESGGYDTTSGGGDSGGDTGGGDEGGGAVCATHWAQAPRATSTSHIDGFNPVPEIAGLLALNPWAARAANPVTGPAFTVALTGLITGLAVSANPAPPASFNNAAFGGKWGQWRASREYRGYVDMFQFKVRCDSKTGTLIAKVGTPGNKVGDFIDNQNLWSSHGFTRLPGPVFQGGEPPAVKPWTNIVAFGDAAGGNKTKCVTNFGYIAARIGAVERAAAFPVLGFDAPFIWEDLSSTVCCDGTYDVRFVGSHFPTQSLYINFDRVKFLVQTGLPAFISSGGPILNAVGVGLLAAAGVPSKVAGNARLIDDCNGKITQEFTPKPSAPVP